MMIEIGTQVIAIAKETVMAFDRFLESIMVPGRCWDMHHRLFLTVKRIVAKKNLAYDLDFRITHLG